VGVLGSPCGNSRETTCWEVRVPLETVCHNGGVARHNYVRRNSLTFAQLLARLQAMREVKGD